MRFFSSIGRFVLIGLVSMAVHAAPGAAAGQAAAICQPAGEGVVLSRTDYSKRSNWILYENAGDKAIDVFAVYPTVTFSPEEADKPYVRLDSELMRGNARGWIAGVADILSVGNVYAPLYRQLNGASLADLDSSGFLSLTGGTPREDVFAAFDHYLNAINRGERPFILFGFSQGAQLVADIATRLLGDESYARHNKNHIATYAIGISVTDADIARNPALKFARGRDDTAVILSWNTTAPSEIASGAYKRFGTWRPGALTINPVTWTTAETLAHAGDNKGTKVVRGDGSHIFVDSYANALVDNEHRVLVTTTVDEANGMSGVASIGKFHSLDVTLFYGSVRQNLNDRMRAYFAGGE